MLSNTYFKTIGRLGKTDTSVKISKDNRGNDITQTNVSVVAISDDKATIEQMKVSMTGGVMTILSRGLNNSETVVSDPLLKKDRGYGTEIYITALAPDIVSPSQTNSFSQKQTFTDIDVTGTGKITNTGKLQIDGKFQGPVVADPTARDLLYPVPVSGNEVFVTSLNAKQIYNGGSAQRETLGVSTPTPAASELASGTVRLATKQEAIDGISSLTAVSPKNMTSARTNLVEEIFPLGEAIIQDDLDNNRVSLFLERIPSFGMVELEFGKAAGNARVYTTLIGTGIASDKLKLGLRKYGSPSADVKIRIETDNAGKPSGTLVDANATATILASSLTTTLVDTEATLTGSISITKGTTVHIVVYAGTYGSETVNETNYFGIGYANKKTRSFGNGLYNGTIYSSDLTKFIYTSSVLFYDAVLSKTSATDSYLLPSDYPRLATRVGARGDIVPVVYSGLYKTIGLLSSLLYIGDVAGSISNIIGSNKYIIGYVDNNSLYVNDQGTYTMYGNTYSLYSKSVNVPMVYTDAMVGVLLSTLVFPKAGQYTIYVSNSYQTNSGTRVIGLYIEGVLLTSFSIVSSTTPLVAVNVNIPYNNTSIQIKPISMSSTLGITLTNYEIKCDLYTNTIKKNSIGLLAY